MITKITYRNQVRELILDKMKTGELKAGESLSLASIARDLEVSVTPIREALTQLEQSRIIKSAPNRGFIIPELNNVIAKDLYQLVATLESLAIENSVYSKSIIKKLKKQQEKIETSNNAIDRVNEDIIFHNILTSQYKNETAQQILLDLKTRIFFYELEFMSLDNSLNQQHNQIINYLENGQIKDAVKILKLNWLQVLDFLKL
ncbi:GntR family transcriptional regulator [Subsaximicrobium wynnwilliamsii]|jgi:DNA-binding GntR family transcriptional regulator|uniref:GntR family transcriptional regulator n=2 Tax=Flavobacteriaceae TaxID=49546 RepID=A0A5C6ZBE6_9FLAO|nr:MULTISPECIES: GntR family transcriptional regulator [Flavobacteriaceae]EHQ02077.1 transcriptional regulator, GntR family [Gillisia limnaea DSM 15749]TXD80887.1 GntR family transcriptional regulator [Subsaximicrobium wynnwilliamsii]TXD86599.1 GntR family transcriptional regulator [Subsaximicrobium wynnwilliamsii]TXE00185.1 GntR family transcriptional regulator [Subsaximicrobium wynnwilliamsii]